jgi:uncharacterized damage-inducible protein DinB
MKISEMLLPEFEMEMASTRKTLERVPEDKLDWKPHEKSMSMGRLANHLVEIPAWMAVTIQKDSFDVNPPGGAAFESPKATSRKEMLATFDKSVAEARAVLAAVDDAPLFQPWSLLAAGKTVFSMPRIAVLRSFVLSHNVHHRAQLGVYLRLNNIPVPAVYGPSADEK